MSIWSSGPVAGEDDRDNMDGSVVSYISGWSNHYPGHGLPHHGVEAEQPASVGTGWIPSHCVPGHEDVEDADAVGPWLRLDITHREVSIWSDEAAVAPQDVTSVCMTESAVLALRDHLTEWLDTPKVHPKEAS